MELSFVSRLKRGWNAFFNKDPTKPNISYGMGYSYRPDRMRFSRGNERSIVTSVYNRIAMEIFNIFLGSFKIFPCLLVESVDSLSIRGNTSSE